MKRHSMAEPISPTADLGREMYDLATRLFPICRSITGDGVRETLRLIADVAPVEVIEVPSGTPVLDWTVPREWNIRDAWIADLSGARVVDFRQSNLHVVSYSGPVRARLSLAELRPHLHTLPDQPARIPYRTGYYDEGWGFCLTQDQLDRMPEGPYEVCIDSTLQPGHLTYGELALPGETEEEILISTHVCHPSLADDNLSGLVVAAFLARHFAKGKRRLGLRFLFAPGTIGAITWLARNLEGVGRIRHGLTLACLGDDRPFTYKRTIFGSAEIDRVAPYALQANGLAHQVVDYVPYGYDERQFNSPGFRLPVGSLMRGRDGGFPEYHTSGDDLAFISPERLAESWQVIASLIETLDSSRRYRSLEPYGEPQLGRRGLYRAVGGSTLPGFELALLWVLSFSDGTHSLLDIALRSGLALSTVKAAAEQLEAGKLLAQL